MNIDINGLNANRSDGQKRQVSNKSLEHSNAASSATQAAEQSSSSSKVSVSLSSSAQNLTKIEAELKALPEVNQARVDDLKARIDRGEYQPDSANLAQKMLNLE
jgi:negative regulator of flagellin synthesis FlgM|tara:strand:+ start:153 stop:464 length:312 start_codon:yes stop_codon:yes gene_type:complete